MIYEVIKFRFYISKPHHLTWLYKICSYTRECPCWATVDIHRQEVELNISEVESMCCYCVYIDPSQMDWSAVSETCECVTQTLMTRKDDVRDAWTEYRLLVLTVNGEVEGGALPWS